MAEETEKRELQVNLPEDVIQKLSGLALVDNKSTDPDTVADAYITDAVTQYIANRKADPSFPDQLAASRARNIERVETQWVIHNVDTQTYPQKPGLN